jgi:vacuolar-type H+-ATPase subunit D/Vma8
MPEMTRREKMISLRLSEAEYEAVKNEYRRHGANSVSELARLALQLIISKPSEAGEALETKVRELDARVNALEMRVLPGPKDGDVV